jgi:hypothetical protein
MGNIGVQLDQHTLDRLDALTLLLREVEPNYRCDRNEAVRLSLDVGLKLLLGELLARDAQKKRTLYRRGI